jgi:glycosyltransferase involved in cell wall biosynthesis
MPHVQSMSRRERVLLVANKPGARNPVLQMYIQALQEQYDVSIACWDPDALAANWPGVRTTRLTGASMATRLRDALRPAKNAVLRAIGQEVGWNPRDPFAGGARLATPAPPTAAGSGRRRLLAGRIRTLVADAVAQAAYIRRLGRHDAIIAIDADVLLACWLLARSWGVRYAYYMYEIWPYQFEDYSPDLSYTLAVVERFGVRRAYRSIVPHPVTGSILVRRYGIPRSATEINLVCPALPARCSPPTARSPMRFYYHGGYSVGRGIENLVRAVRDVDGATLTLRGTGPLEPMLRELIAAEGLGDRVTMAAALPVAQLAAAGADFDVGVNVTAGRSANHRFNMGFKTYENMAAGLALLSTRSLVLGPFTRDHGVGMTFEGAGVASIGEAMRYCVAHPEQVAEWKRRSRAAAEREFNADVQGARLRATVAAMIRPRTAPDAARTAWPAPEASA